MTPDQMEAVHDQLLQAENEQAWLWCLQHWWIPLAALLIIILVFIIDCIRDWRHPK